MNEKVVEKFESIKSTGADDRAAAEIVIQLFENQGMKWIDVMNVILAHINRRAS
jgi:hypothetical protein